ncbi:MAG: hypothetical protein Q7R76_05775 [Candidatus Woesearchaeota archaeon]|nr:hypothetical protein [Candidatus Woesearchaeota archaeon]
MKPSFAQVLLNRVAINILKIVYDHEVTNKNQYSLNLSVIQRLLLLVDAPTNALMVLANAELITTDAVHRDIVLSITHKGKEFIEAFDQLKEIYEGDARSVPTVPAIRYNLTVQEKKMLAALSKISSLSAASTVSFKTLARELRLEKKPSSVMRTLTKLEQLNLIKKELIKPKKQKGKRQLFVALTDKGTRTVKEQYLETA